MGTRKGQTIKEEKRNYKSRFWHVNCTLPPLPIHGELFINIPLLQVPLHCLCPRQGLRWICPNHLKRCCISFSSIGATPTLSRMSSFRTRSLLVWPHIQRNIRISATHSCWTCRLLVGQHSAPYNIAGRIAVL
ncbi:hypothetical protein ZEAMMB73_Zm00001d021742 [Zea mays]|uniref:Uncharacterized protein n=1 Tax=Zea mays TaxID=4577 RepID=A0A1D6EFS8_MAIZE|nr:hypothetical protein ZEAMMB73_Zm00001d037027 [Zea mays]ONM19035.1 hypothetical protein ZEAMMB73_Zm00001d004499 [Zea mays]ONM25834.1 hypothetical protein ZEAMMB73_Zm00001d007087 [Zea mays]ONM29627.1 hypothetical protein ZEAMMB73_Zm00001d039665 [Zea mays]ONM58263.1 hypothetical protein ZEAMMB73_Zm00001d021742 [Zea mays]